MARCAGFKPNGEPCERIVGASHSYCFGHDPERKEERRRNAFKAGKGKASKVTKGLHELLEDLTTRVVDGELETSRGAVTNQLIGTRIRLLEYERRLKETEELEERLETLERSQEAQNARTQTNRSSGRWGA